MCSEQIRFDRRTFLAVTLLAPWVANIDPRRVSAAVLTHDERDLLEYPLISQGTPHGRPLGLTYADITHRVDDQAVLINASLEVNQFTDSVGQNVSGGGIVIENGLPFGAPEFCRSMISRIVVPGQSDTWMIGQLIGSRIEKIIDLAAGTDQAKLGLQLNQLGTDGIISFNNASPLSFPFLKSVYGDPQHRELKFAAYSQNALRTTISRIAISS